MTSHWLRSSHTLLFFFNTSLIDSLKLLEWYFGLCLLNFLLLSTRRVLQRLNFDLTFRTSFSIQFFISMSVQSFVYFFEREFACLAEECLSLGHVTIKILENSVEIHQLKVRKAFRIPLPVLQHWLEFRRSLAKNLLVEILEVLWYWFNFSLCNPQHWVLEVDWLQVREKCLGQYILVLNYDCFLLDLVE